MDAAERPWVQVHEAALKQGDHLPGCLVPVCQPDFPGEDTIPVRAYDLIIITQTCDLAHDKVRFVALLPIAPVPRFVAVNPTYNNQANLAEIHKGRREGLHLLPGQTAPADPQAAFVVDFREIYSLPYPYVARRAEEIGARWRLQPPFLEKYSQAFAHYFMRVATPDGMPAFKPPRSP